MGSSPLCPQHQWGAGSLSSSKKPKCWADLSGDGVGMLRVLLWEDEPSRACQHRPGPEERLQGARAEQRGAQPRRSSCGELGSPGRPGFGARAPTLPAASRRRVGGRIETVMERVGRAMAWSSESPLLVLPGQLLGLLQAHPCCVPRTQHGRCVSPCPASHLASPRTEPGLHKVLCLSCCLRSPPAGATSVPVSLLPVHGCRRGLTCWMGAWASPFPPQG